MKMNKKIQIMSATELLKLDFTIHSLDELKEKLRKCYDEHILRSKNQKTLSGQEFWRGRAKGIEDALANVYNLKIKQK